MGGKNKPEEKKVEEVTVAPATEAPAATEAPVVSKAPKTKSVYVQKAGVTDTGRQFVSVNGKAYLLPKGDTHELPVEIADEVLRGQRAEKRRDEEAAKRVNVGK